MYGFLYGLNQAEVVCRHADEHDTHNTHPVNHAVATLMVVVIAIAFVTLQQGCMFVGEATAMSMPTFGMTADEHGTQIVQ